jgi:hypothetical protein
MFLYVLIVLLCFIGSLGAGLYAWWESGELSIGLVLFLFCAAFSTFMSLPLILTNMWQGRRKV